jgi:hypothetical protein
VDQPIACSLSSAPYTERVQQLSALRRDAMLERSAIAGGERLLFADAPGIESSLRAAIDAEAECCSFLTLTLEHDGDRLVLDITGPEMARPIIAELFA